MNIINLYCFLMHPIHHAFFPSPHPFSLNPSPSPQRALDQLKKERQKKLLDESERSQSNAGKADEIRARRAAEERERRMREKERDDAIKKKKDITELVGWNN